MQKYVLFSLGLLALGATGCVAANEAIRNIPYSANPHRLPTLEPTVEMGALANTDGTGPEGLQQVFRAEITRNVAEPGEALAYGYAHLVVTQASMRRTGRAWQVMQVATMLVPSLFGVPLETYQTSLTAKVQIRNALGKVLGEYVGRGQASIRVAFYHGYSQSQAPVLSDVVAVRQALAEIRPQLDSAALRLRPLLLATGPTVEIAPSPMPRPVAAEY